MSDDTRFQDAVEALRKGEKARAREILTALIQDEQTNPTYWVWMSAVVDSPKERIYCLQTALKLDPGNAAAKRGLVLFGALPPDDSVRPFPLNHPRAWEQQLMLAHELPKPTGVRAWTTSPLARLAAIGLGGVLLLGLVIAGFMLRPSYNFRPGPTQTAGPSPTYSPTPTLIGGAGALAPTFIGPTPLWAFLNATYTPTPLYVSTPRLPQSSDQFRVARDAYRKGDWDTFILQMREIARLEPEAADVQYLIGEAYRFEGNSAEALASYNDALRLNDKFGPAYLGLARARLMRDPNADVTGLFDIALEYDPDFGEVYLERANYHLYHDDAQAALDDLNSAKELMSGSPLVYYGLARTYQELEDISAALENAEEAYKLDITLLPDYLLRGELYLASRRYQDAIDTLSIYTNYKPEDGEAFALLGECYYQTKDYKTAIDFFTKAIRLDSRQRQIYLPRAFSYLETGNPDEAQVDFDRAVPFAGETFEIKIGQTRAYYAQEKYGSAYQQAESAYVLAKGDEEKAIALYWRALSNEGRGALKEAISDWKALLALPASAMSEAVRLEAEEHLQAIVKITPSVTPKPVTPTRTRPPVPGTPTRTPTRTPTP